MRSKLGRSIWSTVVPVMTITLIGLLEIHTRASTHGVVIDLWNKPINVSTPHAPWLQMLATAAIVFVSLQLQEMARSRYTAAITLAVTLAVCGWGLTTAAYPPMMLLTVDATTADSQGNPLVEWLRAGALSGATYVYLAATLSRGLSFRSRLNSHEEEHTEPSNCN